MKKVIAFLMFAFITFNIVAQQREIYNPKANADADIRFALKQATAEHKFVLLQGGGNWCKWCIEFHRFCTADAEIDSIINKNFIWYHLNFSKENKNEDVFAKYGYPQRFGFPVFIILNEKGERIHTQNSEYLEDGKGSYDKKKVIEFLNAWNSDALNAENYK